MPKSLIDKLYAAGMLRMEEPPGAPGGGGTPPVPTPPIGQPAAPAGAPQFSQEDLSRIATAEHDKGERKGKQAALEEVAQTLGMSVEDAAAVVKAAKDAQDALKSQAEKDAEAAAAERKAAADDRAAAALELHQARLSAILSAAGVDEKAQAAIAVPGITVGSTREEIQAAVDKLKEDVPVLFGTTPQPPAPPRGDPRPGGGGKPPAGGGAGAEGKRRAEARLGARK